MLAAAIFFGGQPATRTEAQVVCDPITLDRCLVIRKETTPASMQAFNFTHTLGTTVTNFTLANGGQTTFNITGAPQTVVELPLAGFVLQSITCTGTGVTFTTNTTAGTVALTVTGGQAI